MILGSGCADEGRSAKESPDKGRRPAENPRRSAPPTTRRLDAYDSDPAPVHQRSPHDGLHSLSELRRIVLEPELRNPRRGRSSRCDGSVCWDDGVREDGSARCAMVGPGQDAGIQLPDLAYQAEWTALPLPGDDLSPKTLAFADLAPRDRESSALSSSGTPSNEDRT